MPVHKKRLLVFHSHGVFYVNVLCVYVCVCDVQGEALQRGEMRVPLHCNVVGGIQKCVGV